MLFLQGHSEFVCIVLSSSGMLEFSVTSVAFMDTKHTKLHKTQGREKDKDNRTALMLSCTLHLCCLCLSPHVLCFLQFHPIMPFYYQLAQIMILTHWCLMQRERDKCRWPQQRRHIFFLFSIASCVSIYAGATLDQRSGNEHERAHRSPECKVCLLH